MNAIFQLNWGFITGLSSLAACALPGILMFRYVQYSAAFYHWNYDQPGLPNISASLLAGLMSSFLYTLFVVLIVVKEPTTDGSVSDYREVCLFSAVLCLGWLLCALVSTAHVSIQNKYLRWAISIYAVAYCVAYLTSVNGVTFLEAISYAYSTIAQIPKNANKIDAVKVHANPISERILSAAFFCSATYVAGLYLGNAIVRRRSIRRSSRVPIGSDDVGLLVMVYAVIYFAMATVTLAVLQVDPIALGAFSAIVGATLSIVFRDVLRDIFSGVILSLDNTIRVGDYIRTGDGVFGEIRNIGLRQTFLETRDNIDLLIPNSSLAENRVENFTRTNQEIRLSLPFAVALDANINVVQQLALDSCKMVPEVAAVSSRTPILHYLGPIDGAHRFDLRFWVSNPRPGIDKLKSDVAFAVFRKFKEYVIPLAT
jgi:small-conductance mechanosensitive channel